MKIKNMNLTLYSIGVNREDGGSKFFYPVLSYHVVDASHVKEVRLDVMLQNRNAVKRVFVGASYITLQVNSDYQVFDLDKGVLRGSFSMEEYGEMVGFHANSFLCMKNLTATLISGKGFIVKRM